MNNLIHSFVGLAGLTIEDFHQVTEISQGFNQSCYILTTTKGQFIAKRFSRTANLTTEAFVFDALNNSSITALLIDQNKDTLLLEMLQGNTLNTGKNSSLEKLDIAVELMAKFHHQFKIMPIENSPLKILNLQNIFDNLITYAQLSSREKINTLACVKDLIHHINKKSMLNNIVCHGDINFTNIITSKGKKSENKHWLIDFESACLMPAEYDIAMMIAVNEFTILDINHSLNCYVEQVTKLTGRHLSLDEDLINLYYLSALLINGLWYLGKYKKNNNEQLLKKANQQLLLLSHFYPKILSFLS